MSRRARGRPPVDGGRRSGRVAWSVFGLIVVCLICGLTLSVLIASGDDRSGPGAVANAAALSLAMFAFPVVGVLIATRQPRNPIGWILLVIGVVWITPTDGYLYYGLVTAPGSLPRPDLVAVVTASWWVPGIGLIGTFLLLLFPDGHPPSPRWRPFAWLAALVIAGLTVIMPLLPAPLTDIVVNDDVAARLPDTANPLGIDVLAPVLSRIFLIVALVPICIAGSALSLVVRFRRSRGQERLQLKWLAAAGAVTATIYVVTMVASLLFGGELWDDQTVPVWLGVLQDITVYAFVLIPVAIGVAVLRHRLYDIDRLVSRTVTYAIVVAALVAVYLVVIGAMTRVLPSDSDLAVAASTLTAAAVFRPLQGRVRRAVDRRFNRVRFDAQREVERFARGLRDQTDPEVVAVQLDGVIGRTLQPSIVQVWTRPSADAASPRAGRRARTGP